MPERIRTFDLWIRSEPYPAHQSSFLPGFPHYTRTDLRGAGQVGLTGRQHTPEFSSLLPFRSTRGRTAGDEIFLSLSAHGFDGALPRQRMGPAAAFFLINNNDGPPCPSESGGPAVLMLAEASVDIGRHPGIEGSIAASQDIEGPDSYGRLGWDLVLPGFHLSEHTPITGFHRPASPLIGRGYVRPWDEVNPRAPRHKYVTNSA